MEKDIRAMFLGGDGNGEAIAFRERWRMGRRYESGDPLMRQRQYVEQYLLLVMARGAFPRGDESVKHA